MIKLKLRGDAPAITWTNAEVEALITERDAALNMIKGQATVIDTWRRTAEQLEAERDKLLERPAANAHYDEKILAENLKMRTERDRLITARMEALAREAELRTECNKLCAALEGVLADIADYERVNNLAPSPGRKYCWQSVEIARRALEETK
jgi:hypothetical protein